MAEATLYYNPNCSKCRGARELLEARDLDLTIVEYLDVSVDRDTLITIIESSDSMPAEFIRTGETAWKDSGLALSHTPTVAEVADLIVQCPGAMQRPIFVVGGKAVIARPPDRVLELI